ncbi:restriction endonuclease subunit S [Salinimicrobium soli]|uniref:restriction endonuclease subunit S n=1 Tax=Salinimicrobium soli TaxID=1254399 RepID=UPI003AAFB3AB
MEGYVKTDIGLIPQDWNLYKLGEVATFRRGSFPQPYGLDKWYDDNNGYPFVQVYDVGDNLTLKATTKRKISEEAAEKSVLAKKGTLLLTIQGSIGRMAIAHYDTYVDRTLLLFNSFKVPIDKNFFMFTVFRLFELEKQRAHGSTIKTITKAQLTNFQIPLPPYPEQQKIADILGTVDKKIQVIDEQILKTEKLKKGVMQRLLTEGIGHTEFKDSPLGKIPKSWQLISLYDLRNKKDKYGFTGGPFGSDLKSEHYTLDGVKVIQLQNIGEGKFIEKGIIYTSEEKADELKSCNIYPNDIILAKMAPVARCCIVPSLDERYVMCSDGIRLSVDRERFDNDFIFQALNCPYFRNQAESKSTGTTRARIGLNDLKKTVLIVPPDISEQKKLAQILKTFDEKINVLDGKKMEYHKLKNGLMQTLLTGKIRVNNPIEV